jgi:hypothetical protein
VAETTVGNLEVAEIVECEEFGNRQIRVKEGGGISLKCHFNPFEYTIKQSNSYKPKFKKGSNVPNMEFTGPGKKTLSLKLYFDSYEKKEDISLTTRKLWQLMKVKDEDEGKPRPPPVAFRWGSLEFYAVIESVSQKFTLFLHTGMPVRAEVTISLSQHRDSDEYLPQNPTSGAGPLERIWQVRGGDRLDLIAAEVYSDASKWRLIAEHNDIVNPFLLRAGQTLRIPMD